MPDPATRGEGDKKGFERSLTPTSAETAARNSVSRSRDDQWWLAILEREEDVHFSSSPFRLRSISKRENHGNFYFDDDELQVKSASRNPGGWDDSSGGKAGRNHRLRGFNTDINGRPDDEWRQICTQRSREAHGRIWSGMGGVSSVAEETKRRAG